MKISPKFSEHRLFIGGGWHRSVDTFEVIDPGTAKPIAEVSDATVEQGLEAVAAAHRVLPKWRGTAPRERAEILRRAFDLMVKRLEEIARNIALESGKALKEARAEVAYAAEFLRWFSEEAVRISGDFYPAPNGAHQIIVTRQPIGVCLFVTPWNFPAAMATRKIGPALAAGCTIVLKPAEQTPLTALLIGQIFHEAGLPEGVLNIVPTTRSSFLVAAVLADERVRKLSFTGSTKTGRLLLAQASNHIVKCSMELGGNAPFVIFDDADMEVTVSSAVVAKTRNGGQSCTAANRFYVHRRIAEEFCEKFAKALDALKLGYGPEETTEVGPVINAPSRDRIAKLVACATERGATALNPARLPETPGYFVQPVVLSNVDAASPVLRDEIFGPVAPVVCFEDEEEVIRLCNDTPMGLVSFVCSSDFRRAMRVGERLECGMVGINRGVVSDPAAPFGGWKQSGLGREGGREGILEFLETKYIAATWQ